MRFSRRMIPLFVVVLALLAGVSFAEEQPSEEGLSQGTKLVITGYCDNDATKIVQEVYPRGWVMTVIPRSGNKYFVAGMFDTIVFSEFQAKNTEEREPMDYEQWLEKLGLESPEFLKRARGEAGDCQEVARESRSLTEEERDK